MVRVNVVAKPGWILERLAREVVSALPGAKYNAGGYPPHPGTGPARLTYLMPMSDIKYIPEVDGIRVGLFTHGEDRIKGAIRGNRYDAAVVMNQRIQTVVRKAGVKKVILIRPGSEGPGTRPVFGVCGHFHNAPRKGVHLIKAAVEAGFDVRACTSPRTGDPGCPISHGTDDRTAFYSSIDYLLVTSTDEGGPMTVPEAVAHHVPVIAPNVGWAWEYPVIRYERGDWPSLLEVLSGLSTPPTWEAWRQGHINLFEALMRGAA